MAYSGQRQKCDPKIDNLRSDIAMNKFAIAKDALNEFDKKFKD